MKNLVHDRASRVAGALALGCLVSGVSLLFPASVEASTVLVIVQTPGRDDAASKEMAATLVQDIRLYPGLQAALFNPSSPVIKKAVRSGALMRSEVTNPAEFGAAVRLGTALGADYVLLGAFPAGGALASIPGGRSTPAMTTEWRIGDVRSANLSLLEVLPEARPGLDPGAGLSAPAADSARDVAAAVARRLTPVLPDRRTAGPGIVGRPTGGPEGSTGRRRDPEPGAASGRPQDGRAETLWQQAEQDLRNGQPGKAASGMSAAIALAPDNGQYRSTLAALMLSHGQAASAVALYEDAATVDPFNAAIRLGLGKALLSRGDTAGALAAFRNAARIAPESGEIHLALGKLLMGSGSPVEAVPELDLAFQKGDSDAAGPLVESLLTAGNLGRAEQVLKAVIQTESSDPLSSKETGLAPAPETARVLREQLASVQLGEGKPAAAVQTLLDGVRAGVVLGEAGAATASRAMDAELTSALGNVAAAPEAELEGLRARLQAAGKLAEALAAARKDDKQQQRRSAAASDLLQAVVERIHPAAGDPSSGDVTVLIAHARQVLGVAP